MILLAGVLHTIAFIITLNIQFGAGIVGRMWIPFHLAGCIILLLSKRPKPTPLTWATLAWLVMLSASAFVIQPVRTAMMQWWFLIIMPTLALSMTREALPFYCKAFGGVIFIYACGLITQEALSLHYTTIDYTIAGGRTARAWPLDDPNNASCLLNCLLIPCMWLGERRRAWWVVAAVLLVAIFLTGSYAGILVAGLFFIVITRAWWVMLPLPVGLFFVHDWSLICEHFTNSSMTRAMLWADSFNIWRIEPWRGVGLGLFPYYYSLIRTEQWTQGSYVHNDILQFITEMGWPAGIIFCWLLTQARRKIKVCPPATFAFLGIFLQSLAEFQFYVPSISMAAGFFLACLILTDGVESNSIVKNGGFYLFKSKMACGLPQHRAHHRV